MKQWTQKQLEKEGYKIINMVIEKADISMENYGVAVLQMGLKGSGYGCTYGGYVLGIGYLGAKYFDGSNAGMESILRIMDVVGVESFADIKGKYIRAATTGCGKSVKIIGNILEDRWFDIKSFYDDKNSENILAKRDWIPYSKEPPKYSGEYIVTVMDKHKNRKIVHRYYWGNNVWGTILDCESDFEVVAWLPNPKEPWKGDIKLI